MNTLDSIDKGLTLLRSREEERFPISGSSIGTCARALAFQACAQSGDSKIPVRELAPRALRVFRMGDISEDVLVSARVEGLESDRSLESVVRQREVWTTLPLTASDLNKATMTRPGVWMLPESLRFSPTSPNVQIRSRIDLLIGTSEGVDLEEYKSAGSFPFKKAKEEGPGESYLAQVLCQIRGLMEEGLLVRSATIIYHSKDDSELFAYPVDWTSPKMGALLDRRLHFVAHAVLAWAIGAPNTIPGEYAELFSPKTGKLPWQCTYCMVGPEAAGCLAHRGDLTLEGKPKGDLIDWYARPTF